MTRLIDFRQQPGIQDEDVQGRDAEEVRAEVFVTFFVASVEVDRGDRTVSALVVGELLEVHGMPTHMETLAITASRHRIGISTPSTVVVHVSIVLKRNEEVHRNVIDSAPRV